MAIGTHTPRQIKDVTQLAAKRLQHLREGVDEMLETESKAPINPEVAAHKGKVEYYFLVLF